ncbi:MAG: RsmF rRNA methyltransferase first C-terminal domain-containing protein, partial [Bacillus sp. (in: Bacteria)]|nr:RsmF rRNA methyltransferase first C-terminal domain-containing protein [Bacillus sp. (in: firmicutes)]
TVITNETPERLSQHFPFYFDKILLDAPCSGEGMFRKDEETRQYWSQEHVELCRERQLEILDSAYQMLKENGILVYSTCTFSPEENEQVIETFLNKYPDMDLLTIEKRNGIEGGRPEWTKSRLSEVEKCARLWPHKLKGEGHFAAKLIKTSTTPESPTKPFKSKKKQDWQDYCLFEKEYLQQVNWKNLHVLGSVIHSLPDECPDLSGLRVIRAGLHLGELKKNRFEPNHALALALMKNQCRQTIDLSLEGEDWQRYLKGETLKGTGQYKGWVLMTINGFPLGWGKESNGIIKNLYPKGLRIM